MTEPNVGSAIVSTIDVHVDINMADDVADVTDTLQTLGLVNMNKAYDVCQQIIEQTLSQVKQTDKQPKKAHTLTQLPCLSVSLYFVDTNEGKQLNQDYRQKNYATNVLSFPSELDDLPDEVIMQMQQEMAYPLGELIMCVPVLQAEAKQQHKTVLQHFSHLLIHGCLHLLGYDHEIGISNTGQMISQADADIMENLEIAILQTMNIANPYD